VLFGVITLISITALVGIFLCFFQCDPPDALWNTYKVDNGQAHCIDGDAVDRYFIGGASFWCSMDFLLAALPITIVWNLKLSHRKKIAISCLLGLGFFAGICAIFKVYYLQTLLANEDTTWMVIALLIWDDNEINVIIIAACIAVLRPLYLLLSDPKGAGEEYRHPRHRRPDTDELEQGAEMIKAHRNHSEDASTLQTSFTGTTTNDHLEELGLSMGNHAGSVEKTEMVEDSAERPECGIRRDTEVDVVIQDARTGHVLPPVPFTSFQSSTTRPEHENETESCFVLDRW